MPEAAAQHIQPPVPKAEQPGTTKKESWVKYNDQGQIDFQESVKNRLAETGIQHDPVPPTQRKPIHVPVDGSTHKTIEVKKGALDVPDTHKSDVMADNVRHFVDFTGSESGAPPRTDDANKMTATMKEREAAVMEARNNPEKEKRGIVINIRDWLFDKEAKAGKKVIRAEDPVTQQKPTTLIHAEDRFGRQKEDTNVVNIEDLRKQEEVKGAA